MLELAAVELVEIEQSSRMLVPGRSVIFALPSRVLFGWSKFIAN